MATPVLGQPVLGLGGSTRPDPWPKTQENTTRMVQDFSGQIAPVIFSGHGQLFSGDFSTSDHLGHLLLFMGFPNLPSEFSLDHRKASKS